MNTDFQILANNKHLPYSETNLVMLDYLGRINNKISRGLSEQEIQKELNSEGNSIFTAMANAIIDMTTPKVKVYKIKRSPKGQRIKIRSESGKLYSFGPIWVESIKAAKGLAVSKNNREKLEMHASHVGLTNFKNLSSVEIAKLISEKL